MTETTRRSAPAHPELSLRESPMTVATKVAVPWILALAGLGAGGQAILQGTAGGAHYAAVGIGALFALVGLTPQLYRAELVVAAHEGFLYLPVRKSEDCLCLPLSTLRAAEVKLVSRKGGSSGGPAWMLELQLDLDPNEEGADQVGLHDGAVLLSSGGAGKDDLTALAERLLAMADRGGRRVDEPAESDPAQGRGRRVVEPE